MRFSRSTRSCGGSREQQRSQRRAPELEEYAQDYRVERAMGIEPTGKIWNSY